jgi:sulfide:quinone oxidoreductase
MDLRTLTPSLSVSGQILPADLPGIAAKGFRGLIDNRPDGEEEDQPASAALAAIAKSLGLDFRNNPVVPGQLGDEKVAAFRAALAELEGPILAFCRTGTRSAGLWALSEAHRQQTSALIRAAAEAGYDLGGLAPRLATLAEAAAKADPRPDSPLG